jgi:hypothetical protein
MASSEERPPVRVQIQPLRGKELAKEIVGGVGRAMGLTLLWGLEIARDKFFRMLDRLNVRARKKRASAFPPGRPRKHTPA